jgi:tetratricopeptide (TPR) repeat protein
MPTKLSRYCDGAMEAAWLAAVILVPVFFNIYSSRIFEPDKITLLRSLALLILLAWLVKIVELGGFHWVRLEPGKSKIKSFLKIPLVAPALGIAILYLLATLFSITPSVSLWGSYQRLQGTYTTLSYLVIFGAIIANLRKRNQLERIITVVIAVSLPVTLYGVLQKFKIDPVPWGGDTSRRIAANLGNSIFVAAYLIMVFPLTVGRIVESFKAILTEEGKLTIPIVKATLYIFLAAMQVIALYMSGSRGPALGWMASSYFIFLLLSLYWRKRWLTLATLGVTVAIGAFLIVFNISGGPLESLRESPAIGRFGLLLDAESNSALVRKYIWEGAAALTSIHEPLEFPDGSKDRFNTIRPLVGYGPESMYVAYNKFYVPDLAHVEKRNASPDRSHNETWDSLVITGVLGIIAYLAVFVSVFYYGFEWTRLINSRKQKILFFTLLLGGGAIGALGLILYRGVEYFGVGMPFGMLIGLLGYITYVAIAGVYQSPQTSGEATRMLVLIVLLAGVIAHFVEINFGIAIAATRTYFWVYSALLLCAGYILPRYNEYEAAESGESLSQESITATVSSAHATKGGKKRRARESSRAGVKILDPNFLDSLAPAFLTGLILVTLGFDYITNMKGAKSATEIVWSALTLLPNRNNALSYGILALVITTWLMVSILLTSERTQYRNQGTWLRSLGWTLLVSASIGIIYWLWQAGALASIAGNTASDLNQVLEQVQRYANLLTVFYVFVFIHIFIMAYFLPEEKASRLKSFSLLGATTGAVGLVAVLILTAYTNLRVVQADISFKLADPFTKTAQWPVAIAIYNRANEMAPAEDYYYLFLGRAYLEYAKTLKDAGQREQIIQQAALDLQKAQSINPLNTDHTANLARLYTLWASYAQNNDDKADKILQADSYFSRAVALSPQNARIWDEWALIYTNLLNEPDKAMERLETALAIDPQYHWTYALIGEFTNRTSRDESDPQKKTELITKAADYYGEALALPTPGEPAAKFNYAIALAGLENQLGDTDAAIGAYQRAIEVAPKTAEIWRVEEALGTLFAQKGDLTNALLYFQNALAKAPADQQERLQNIISQLTQS